MTATLLEAILETAARCGAAFSSTAGAGSEVGFLRDAALLDNGQDPEAYAGGWIYRPNAANASDKLHAVAPTGSFGAQGDITPVREWVVAPAAGEVYHLYAMLSPKAQPGQVETWHRIVNRALGNIWSVGDYVVAAGRSGVASNRFHIKSPVVTLIAGIVVAGGSGATITTPTGWTSIGSVNLSTTIKLALYRRRTVSSDPAEWSVTLDTTREATAFVVAYVDASPGSPVHATGSATSAAATSLDAPTVTTTVPNARVLRIIAASTVASFADADSDELTRQLDAVLQDGEAVQGLALFDEPAATAGAVGAQTLETDTSAGLIAYTLALAPVDEQTQPRIAGFSVSTNGTGGAATIVLERPFPLVTDDWTPNPATVRGCFLEHEDGRRVNMNTQGRWFRLSDDGTLTLSRVVGEGWKVVLEVERTYPALASDTETTECDLDRLAVRGKVELYSHLNGAPATRGKYAAELAAALAEERDMRQEYAPTVALIRR